jgi:hypothetical protein
VCTLSWTATGAALEVFFNRDERNTRGPEIAPRVETDAGVAFVAPRDSDQGGSWVGANDRGLVAGLLNGYDPRDSLVEAAVSRGGLVLAALARRDPESAAAAISELDLARSRSFVLALLSPQREPVVLRWNRERLLVASGDSVRAPLISSSIAGVEVEARRRSVFASLQSPWSAAALEAAHRSHRHGPSAYSVCMHREDGATRSFTRIGVGAESVRLSWFAGSPCRGAAPIVVELPRALR